MLRWAIIRFAHNDRFPVWTGCRLPVGLLRRTVVRTWSGKVVRSHLRTDSARAAVHRMVVACRVIVPVVAYSSEMCPAMSAPVGQVVAGRSEVEIGSVRINLIYTQIAYVVDGINGTEEIVDSDEAQVFAAGKHPSQVIVSFVQVSVVGIHGPAVGNGYSRHVRTYVVQKIVVDFIQVVVLVCTQMQLKCHTVCQETCVDPEVSQAGGTAGHCGQAEGQ